jgi:hypothetical protein
MPIMWCPICDNFPALNQKDMDDHIIHHADSALWRSAYYPIWWAAFRRCLDRLREMMVAK